MNIDDLKDARNKDEPAGMHLPMTTAMPGKTSSAIATVRKNMKTEFIATLVSYVLLTALIVSLRFLVGRGLQYAFFLNTISILLFTMLILNFIYFFRFYVFYKSIGRYDFDMKDSIRKIAYELELNSEIYKTYNICATPLAVLVTIMFIGGKGAFNSFMQILASGTLMSGNMLLIFAVILISFAVTYYFVNLHVRQKYSKHITELKQIMDDLWSEAAN